MPKSNSADKILDHASQLFAQHGYAGTIMDEIAELASVNKATIYYHFKDKENLYEEVLVRHLSALVMALTLAVNEKNDVIEKLHVYIKTFAFENDKRKHLTAIVMREIAGGGDKMPNRAKAEMHKILMLIKSIMTQGLRENLFVPVDVLTLHMMVIGSLSFYITSEPMRKMMTSSDADIQKSFHHSTIDEVSEEIFTMVKNAILKTTKET